MTGSRARADLDKLYAMLPRTTLDDEFGVAVRSMVITVRERLERGVEPDSKTMVAQQAAALMEMALEYEKKSQKAAKEALEAAKTAKNAKKEAKVWFGILCGFLDDDEANVESQAIEEGAPQEEDIALGASPAGEEA